MLIGTDNEGWMPRHMGSSQVEGDNLRLMQSILSPVCNDRVYPIPIDRNVQAARGSSTTVDMNVDEENNKGGQPKH
jgi:hypothetical protein